MKYVLVTGGVISGVGKGILASSIGALLRAYGIPSTAIKVDPYINIDAGTFSPYEHGEVFVLDDGGEVDLDLGNYERFMDVTLGRDNNITTGKIYSRVIERERRGDYLGKTVQVVPHITDAIQEWVRNVAESSTPRNGSTSSSTNREPEVCVIELGGTIGDIESMQFVEAFRQLRFKQKSEFCVVHVSLIIELPSGEQKTKPVQYSVSELRKLGIEPDFIACRSQKPLSTAVKQKISHMCQQPLEQVVCVHQCKSIYHVPLLLEEQGLMPKMLKLLGMGDRHVLPNGMDKWHTLTQMYDTLKKVVTIALVGKYTKLEDSYLSVEHALTHAALRCRRLLNLVYIPAENLEEETRIRDPERFHKSWADLCKADGLLVPGGFGTRGVEGKIAALNWARLGVDSNRLSGEKWHKIPTLGICLGFQCQVIEFARNVLGVDGADSVEFATDRKQTLNPTQQVIVDMPEHNGGDLGGTQRLGARTTRFVDAVINETDPPSLQRPLSILYRSYGRNATIDERHRHRFEVNPAMVSQFEEAGMRFVGHSDDDDGRRMEIMELQNHPFYVGVQYHPEYLTRADRPSPPYLGLIKAACNHLPHQQGRPASVPLLQRFRSQSGQSGTGLIDTWDAYPDRQQVTKPTGVGRLPRCSHCNTVTLVSSANERSGDNSSSSNSSSASSIADTEESDGRRKRRHSAADVSVGTCAYVNGTVPYETASESKDTKTPALSEPGAAATHKRARDTPTPDLIDGQPMVSSSGAA